MSLSTKDTAKPPRVGKPKEEAKPITANKTKLIGKINLNETSVDKSDTAQIQPLPKPVAARQVAQPQTGEAVMTNVGIDIFATVSNRKPVLPDQAPSDPFVDELRKLHKL